MKLEPGVFRVQKKDYSTPYGSKRSRPNSNTVHILRVIQGKGRLVCYLDHELVERSTEEVEEYEILSKFEGDPKIGRCRITLSFYDSVGIKYEWSVSDLWQLKNILMELSWLRKPFGYIPKRKIK
ncbi:MAG: hypothetical protein ABJH04_07560 [Cyclobacteriaceae bacterium]